MPNFSEKVNFIWSIAELLRDAFKRSKYQDVILPFTVLRRIDCVLESTKALVIETHNRYKGKIDNLHEQLCFKSGLAFYNISPFNFERLLDDPLNLAGNLNAYINGFSENMREVIEKFDLPNTIAKLQEANLLYLVVERFKNIDLHTDKVSNYEMGTIFEELIRRFNEALNENPGEHFTPREVIHLMVDLLLSVDQDILAKNNITRTVYDPACGSGGMLTIAKERIRQINPNASVFLFGQEVNPETYAMAKSDLYMVSAYGKDAEQIKYGSTLSNDHHWESNFDYLLANPPYGKEWKQDEKAIREEAQKGHSGRFGAGLPRISDGQLLFLQTMLYHMQAPAVGGSRIAIVMNGSPLFTGDAGSGESEIRRWIMENDWLEAIVALPEQIFYNTGIATYIWILTNRKAEERRGKVQLINALDFWQPMRKSLGNKRRQITERNIEQITKLYVDFKESENSKIFNSTDFGYRKITVDRPLQLNFQASPKRIERLREKNAFINLAVSKKKDPREQMAEQLAGRDLQEKIIDLLNNMPPTLFKSAQDFEKALEQSLGDIIQKIPAAVRKAITFALSEADETAQVCTDNKSNTLASPDLRDTENVPLGEDIQTYFEREVLPHVPDAWINTSVIDHKDQQIGKVGYEISFNRCFYKYQPPRPLEDIQSEIEKLQQEILDLQGGLF
jgi:type I restriction enzyme M protein